MERDVTVLALRAAAAGAAAPAAPAAAAGAAAAAAPAAPAAAAASTMPATPRKDGDVGGGGAARAARGTKRRQTVAPVERAPKEQRRTADPMALAAIKAFADDVGRLLRRRDSGVPPRTKDVAKRIRKGWQRELFKSRLIPTRIDHDELKTDYWPEDSTKTHFIFEEISSIVQKRNPTQSHFQTLTARGLASQLKTTRTVHTPNAKFGTHCLNAELFRILLTAEPTRTLTEFQEARRRAFNCFYVTAEPEQDFSTLHYAHPFDSPTFRIVNDESAVLRHKLLGQLGLPDMESLAEVTLAIYSPIHPPKTPDTADDVRELAVLTNIAFGSFHAMRHVRCTLDRLCTPGAKFTATDMIQIMNALLKLRIRGFDDATQPTVDERHSFALLWALCNLIHSNTK